MIIQQCIETIPLPPDVPSDIKHFTHEDVDLAYSPSTGKCYRLLTTKWKLIQPGTHKGTYTRTLITSSTQLLHRIVAQHFLNDGKPLMDTEYVDHRKHADGSHTQDILTNLRITNHRGNHGNQKHATSKFAGVCWHVKSSKWCAQILINKRVKHIGLFHSESEAARAYIETGEAQGYNMVVARQRFQSVAGYA